MARIKAGDRAPEFALLAQDGVTYGVPKTLGILDGRVTYVIDGQRVVRHVFSSQLGIHRHISEALKTVEQIIN